MTDDRGTGVWGERDGRRWRIGGQAEVDWIRTDTKICFAITSAIPPVFEAYATLEHPGTGEHLATSPLEDPDRHDAAVLAVLSEHSVGGSWWLGYLERSDDSDVVFGEAPKVKPGRTDDARYVLIEAGPEQAGTWREDPWEGVLPDLIFPTDRSWLFSVLWDDDWACIGGSRGLIDAFLRHPDLRHRVREVDPSLEDSTPPGHTAI